MKVYYANYMSDIVEEKEAIGETDNFITFAHRRTREAKISQYGSYHNTEPEAIKAVSDKLAKDVKQYTMRLANAEARLINFLSKHQ
jgi:hypothetical protein